MAGDPEVEDLYETAACGLLRLSLQGTIQRANATFCGWLGFRSSELVGQRRFQDLLVVGSRIFHQTHWLPLLQMQGSVAEVQFEFQHRDGRVIAALVNGQVRGAQIDVAVFVATDRRKYERELLMARRKAEEVLEQLGAREAEFRTLSENSPDVIARFDRSYRYVYINHTRVAKGNIDHLIGKAIGEVGLPEETVTAWRRALEAAFTGEKVTVDFAYEATPGTRSELQAVVVPERNAKGEIMTVLAITRDVTALRAQEKESSQRALLAEHIVGIVSHDLRNPLNAVLMGLHLLRSRQLDPAHNRIVTRISSAAERANRLVADLLDFTLARLGGGLRVEPQGVDLHAVVAQSLDEIRLAYPGRMLKHRMEGGGLGLADGDRLAQVVGNLVSNALTYGTPDEPVTVTTVVSEAAMEIQVHNAGAPISPHVQEQIFEPFRRGEHSVQLGSRSVGLGLYVVNEIARSHGGRVSVQSTDTEGTTFIVRLPRASPRFGN